MRFNKRDQVTQQRYTDHDTAKLQQQQGLVIKWIQIQVSEIQGMVVDEWGLVGGWR